MKVYFAQSVQAGAGTVQRWVNSLPEEKRTRIVRMRREEDRSLALTAHRLLCYALGREGVFPLPHDWAAERYGKPYLKNADVHFSISHSGCVAMCAVGETPVGVDIERVRPISEGVAMRIMSDKERSAYALAEDREDFFYKVWTLKEAYVKYSGKGLGQGLGGITVYPNGPDIPACRCVSIDSLPEYRAAVCARTAVFTSEWVQKSALLEG